VHSSSEGSSGSVDEHTIRRLETRVLDLISLDAGLREILLEITRAVDGMLPAFRSSVLLAQDGRLRVAAAPGVPEEFSLAIDGLAIAEGVGACGTAAQRGEPVIVVDVATDPLFTEFRSLVQRFNIHSCWSHPVMDARHQTLATFALYGERAGAPDAQQLELIRRFGQLVRIAVEHKRQTAVLQQSEARYRSLFELVPVSIWEEDWSTLLPHLEGVDGSDVATIRERLENFSGLETLARQHVKVLAVNQATLQIFEADSIDMLRQYMEVIFNTSDVLPGFCEQLAALLTGRLRHDSEMRLRTCRGRIIHALVSVTCPTPVRRGGRVMLSIMDITARKEAEERFRTVAQTTSDVVWDWNQRTDRIWWNSGLQAVFGYAEDTLETNLDFWLQCIHPEDRERVLSSVHEALHGKGQRWREEYRFRRADGDYAWVLDQGAILRDDRGEPQRMIGSIIDQSEQRRLQEQLRQSQRLDAIGQLTGGVAHDFNNLLTVILGSAESLCEQLTHDQRLRMLAEVTAKAAERGAELTNRLLAFARQQALEPRAVDVNRLIAQMDPLLRRSLGEHIEIELVRGGGLWRAMVDPGQLENALLNLCINARDAMPQGGRLTIETANAFLDAEYANQQAEVQPGRYVMVAVSDTGHGMDAATLAKVFEPFFTTKEVGKGSGLGLSMVYGFTKQSRGHVRLYSEPGEGTTVRLYLPLHRECHRPPRTSG
jgi:PAS domain S-box-containing protein